MCRIYYHFLEVAQGIGREEAWKNRYGTFSKLDQDFDQQFKAYADTLNATSFLQVAIPFEVIKQEIRALRKQERFFKEHINQLQAQAIHKPELTAEITAAFEAYLSKNWIYFTDTAYDQNALEVLFSALDLYRTVLLKTYFRVKKELLAFMVELENGTQK